MEQRLEVHVTVEDADDATSMINVSIDVPELIVTSRCLVSCNAVQHHAGLVRWSTILQLGWLEGFPSSATETLNWTTDQDMSVTGVSDGCGRFVTVNTEIVVVSPLDRDPARYAD